MNSVRTTTIARFVALPHTCWPWLSPAAARTTSRSTLQLPRIRLRDQRRQRDCERLDVVNVRLDREIAVGTESCRRRRKPHPQRSLCGQLRRGGREGSISVINAENNTVAGTIAGPPPAGLHRDRPQGRSGLRGQLRLQHHLRRRPEGAPRRSRLIGAGEEPVAARISPDGKTLVVANRSGNSVSLIDPAARRVRQVFEGCPGASRRRHPARFFQGFCGLLGRPPDHGHRAGARRSHPESTQASKARACPARPPGSSCSMWARRRCSWPSSPTAANCSP
jgi:hypothetical protein